MPSEVFRATSHSSRAQAEEAFHQFPELRQGPEAASTLSCFLRKVIEQGFSSASSTAVCSAGRKMRNAITGKAAGEESESSSIPENGCTLKLSGLCEFSTRGDPTQAIPFSSAVPTTPR